VTDDKPDFDEEHLILVMLDELGLDYTDANVERVRRSRDFKMRLIGARFARVGVPLREVQQRLARVARRWFG
jgi:hypothetical protein